MIKQQGSFLLYALLILAVIGLIAETKMRILSLEKAALSASMKKEKAFANLENFADRLLKRFEDASWPLTCMASQSSSNLALEALQSVGACVLMDNESYYKALVEDLGLFPCLKIVLNSSVFSSRHWRLTVATLSDKPYILQYRIASLAADIPCLAADSIVINPGLMSWRHVN